jgi:hypothetical protein
VALTVLATVRRASVAVERRYHDRFTRSRLHGEWFERTPDIEKEIQRLRNRHRL